jgi:NAD(P)-dependent dehydrogenase (short-subunit alcohol dehydrogenase family)
MLEGAAHSWLTQLSVADPAQGARTRCAGYPQPVAPFRTVLITGATSGIGRATALRLARDGHRVYATGRRREALDELLAEAPPGMTAVRLDLADADSIVEARDRVDTDTGGRGLDVLVNNAGTGSLGPVELMGDDELGAHFETNVLGTMRVIRAFVPPMRERGTGLVVNVGSVFGRLTVPFNGAYSATKYALEALSDALRVELHPFGVRVVIVEPGAVESEFAERATAELADRASAGGPYGRALERAATAGRRRADRLAVPADVVATTVAAVVAARRPAARYVTPPRYRLALAVHHLLPTPLVDALKRRSMGMSTRAGRRSSR